MIWQVFFGKFKMDNKIKEIAVEAARVGGEILVQYFRSSLDVEVKSEFSPLVSKADREAEVAIRKTIINAFPKHIVRGEEFDDVIPGDSDDETINWVIDPLDGTTAYLSGMPSFVVLIAVWQSNNPLLGIIYQPLTKDMWVGTKDGTTLNGIPIMVNDYPNQPLILATTSPDYLSPHTFKAFNEIQKVASVTQFGGDGHLFGSLACGRISLIIEEGLKWHDVAAVVPIVLGAGGNICTFSGDKIQPKKDSYSIIASVSNTLTNKFQSVLRGKLVG